MTIGFALCGSFCTYASVFPVMESVAKKHTVIPIVSHSAYHIDSRFGTAEQHIRRATEICGMLTAFAARIPWRGSTLFSLTISPQAGQRSRPQAALCAVRGQGA